MGIRKFQRTIQSSNACCRWRRLAKPVGIAALCAGTLGASLSGALAAAERSLGGIKIFAPMSLVVKKYGSPDEVRVGTAIAGAAPSQIGPGVAFFGGGSGNPGGGPVGFPGGPGEGSEYGDDGGGGTMEDVPGGPPGGPGGYPGAYPGGPGGIQSAAAARAQLVTWIYDLPNGNTLEFTFSNDGRVIQIRATGYHPVVRTARGVTLGMRVSDIVERYGAPEQSLIRGRVFTQDYTHSYHASFQFYNNKLVGIIVAAVE